MLEIDLKKAAKEKNLPLLRKWFDEYSFLSINKQAIAAGTDRTTINHWRHLIRPPSQELIDPKIWNNKEWLAEHKHLGPTKLSRMTGVCTHTITEKLVKHGLHERHRVIRNSCNNFEWLVYHYATKEEYLKWAKTYGIVPDSNGGMELTSTKCGEIAGVSTWTVYEWLIKINTGRDKINIRDIHEVRMRRKPRPKPTPPPPFLVTHGFLVNRAINIAAKIAENRSARQCQDKKE